MPSQDPMGQRPKVKAQIWGTQSKEWLEEQLFDLSILFYQIKSGEFLSKDKVRKEIQKLSEPKKYKELRLILLDRVGVGAYQQCFASIEFSEKNNVPSVTFPSKSTLDGAIRLYGHIFGPLLSEIEV